MEYVTDLSDPIGKEDMKMLLMIVQGAATLFGLAVIPAIFWRSLTRSRVLDLVKTPPVKPIHFLMVLGIVLFFNGVNSAVIEWNQNLDLPDGGFETWARGLEDRATEVTKFMTSFATFGEFFVGVLVIAVFAGIGEELAFRGFLQPQFQKSFKSVHAGIWIAAIFFSALHLQFYGFVPRVLLGALFGYLYYWSGNLLIPIFAHFVNNLFIVIMIYLGVTDAPGVESEDPTSLPWYGVMISAVICAFLVYRFREIQPKSTAPDDLPA
jgi:membrane protease YdiL (CAAX protease family)